MSPFRALKIKACLIVAVRWAKTNVQRSTAHRFRKVSIVTALVASGGLLVVLPSTGGASTRASVRAHLLTVSNLPLGWNVDHHPGATSLDLQETACLAGLKKPGAGATRATVSFVENESLPALAESLVAGKGLRSAYAKAAKALSHCRSLTLTIKTKPVHAELRKLPLRSIGTTSRAFSLTLTATGLPIGVDFMLFRTKSFVGEVLYVGVGTPTVLTADAFAREAVAKAEGKVPSVPSTVSIVSAPVKIAHTTMGTVGYREVGSGPPLIMIMGFSGTMETWDPRFVDALAHHYEVVTFDNAGIGDTQALSGPLTIDAMANQTSALITALGLGTPDVLGWSMGTMIAQALAVLHPTQVGRLVLCAAYPGTGTVEPSQSVGGFNR